jgi:hypothetical protein
VREPPIAVEVEPELLQAEAEPAEAAAALTTIGTEPLAGAARRRPGVRRGRRRVQRLVSSKSGLRTGFILSEILAPPVALRDNHPF